MKRLRFHKSLLWSVASRDRVHRKYLDLVFRQPVDMRKSFDTLAGIVGVK